MTILCSLSLLLSVPSCDYSIIYLSIHCCWTSGAVQFWASTDRAVEDTWSRPYQGDLYLRVPLPDHSIYKCFTLWILPHSFPMYSVSSVGEFNSGYILKVKWLRYQHRLEVIWKKGVNNETKGFGLSNSLLDLVSPGLRSRSWELKIRNSVLDKIDVPPRHPNGDVEEVIDIRV